ncbi:MAG: ABC transporter ATP-binding protein [Nitriliruptorales bacterium]
MGEGLATARQSPRPIGNGREFGAEGAHRAPGVELRDVVCRLGTTMALAGVDLLSAPGEVHALLGPNGAGKTTLLRVVAGLQRPTAGSVQVEGRPPHLTDRTLRRAVGLVSSGARSFYQRISGLENLVFFARLHGLRRARAVDLAWRCLEAVGLTEAAHKRVGLYSQGMQRRLAVARALLGDPSVLVVDEATHDLDPEGAQLIRALVAARAETGATVLWATQRLDEIRGFAHRVTVLHEGRVVFAGSVPELVASTTTQRFLVRVRNGGAPPGEVLGRLRRAVATMGEVEATADAEHYLLGLREDAVLGEAVAAVTEAGLAVLACREEQSLVETALLRLTRTDGIQPR